ncbi:MarR family winged helix-turn-helix transcriptional regulator [Fictibacillus terranigra]|uniref:MarR family winged helix-turn-helix transcriptional regulator n=1 Tax=Fictibacillus terranigra TaxID=3058424 RepID=A0ABT8EBP6_9BACL|nr:MarR family winged helix-turn-helix transcriptional regulator [Fictibacillus sp. CENA-BCM004]MDN4075339.1 MarR family winged helix-turn-helix transcriptional regulator [Fictibacillus sp. CENA-BCM004]
MNAEKIRKFNRFYTRVLGLMNQYTDKSKFTLLETQLLYEINRNKGCSANDLINFFQLDKGYLSRVLKKLESQNAVIRHYSSEDKRKIKLYLTNDGKKELDDLIALSNCYVLSMVDQIPEEEQLKLIKAMEQIELILTEFVDQKRNK